MELLGNELKVNSQTVPFVLVGDKVWFRANDVAELLEYKQPDVAISKKVEPEHKMTSRELSSKMEGKSMKEDPRIKYISEPGLYALVMSSKQPDAKKFRNWVYEIVLPTLRKQGHYHVNEEVKDDSLSSQQVQWTEARQKGIETHKIKNASLKTLIEGSFKSGVKFYSIVNNMINQAIVGFDITTSKYKKERGFPDKMSMPMFYDFHGQIARNICEGSYQKLIIDKYEILKRSSEKEIITQFELQRDKLRASFEGIGYHDLEKKMLTLEDAKQKQKEIRCQQIEQKRVELKKDKPQCLPW